MQDASKAAANLPRDEFGPPGDMDILLGDLLTVLMQARQAGRAWVGDFFDERVRISSDLYEVLCAARASAM